MFVGCLHALTDQIEITLWRFDPAFRLLLKRVQDINGIPELDGIYGSVRPMAIFIDKLQNTGAKRF